MSDGDPIIYAFGGLGLGAFLFVQGFRWLRQKKLIEELPTSKIRSLAMGLVEIKGKVVGLKEYKLKSPFSGKDCVYYRYKIEEYRSSGKSSRWVTIKSGIEGVPFKLKDNTGEVLVNPDKAKVDIPQDYRHNSGRGKDAPKMITAFCAANHVMTKGWLFNKTMRYTEWFIEPDDQLYILGTAGDNPYVEDTTGGKNEDDIMIQKGKNEKFYYISDKPEENLLKSFKWKVIGGLFGGAVLIVGCLAYILYRFGLF